MPIDTSYEAYTRIMAPGRLVGSPEHYRDWVRYCEALEGLRDRLLEDPRFRERPDDMVSVAEEIIR